MGAEKKTAKKTTNSVAEKKTATAKRAVAKKVASKPVKQVAAEAKSVECGKCDTKSKKLTRVIAKFDAGWGNALFIRGTGAGLDWQKGVPMQSIGEDEWLWEQLVPNGSVSFKVLVNDQQWSEGEDQSVAAGDTVICHPKF